MQNEIVGERFVHGPDHYGSDVRWTVDGVKVELGPSLEIRRHSPTGFEWGYSGSGPAQSALAILLHVLGIRNVNRDEFGVVDGWKGGDAERLYQEFKRVFI